MAVVSECRYALLWHVSNIRVDYLTLISLKNSTPCEVTSICRGKIHRDLSGEVKSGVPLTLASARPPPPPRAVVL
jgi:hypothetical protein